MSYYSSRSSLEFWNLGHIVLFGLLVLFFQKHWKWYQQKSILQRLIFVLTLTGILSLIIEISQYIFANGTPDIYDIRRNFAGAMTSFIFLVPVHKKTLRVILKLAVIIWIGIELIPVGRALADEAMSVKDFPVLADFEKGLELSRWSGDAQYVRSSEHVNHGNCALKVTFGTEKYSGIALNHFPDDWMGYTSLKFDVYYPNSDTLKFKCRIHDAKHIIGKQEYKDRFNRSYKLVRGWNSITIPLNDVKEAPKGRRMDMTHIMSAGIFTIQLPAPKTAWFDYFRLE